MIDPVPQLARAKRLGAEFRHLGGECVAAEPDEIAVRFADRIFARHHPQIWPQPGCIAMPGL